MEHFSNDLFTYILDSGLGDHWMLGHNENLMRMRMKLVHNPNFQAIQSAIL